MVVMALPVQAVQRFPRPAFSTDYTPPPLTTPDSRWAHAALFDVGVLVVALALAGWLALRRRSRRGMWLLTVFSVLYFGFWRRGCVCPVGAIQNVAQGLADPAFVVPLPVLLFFALPIVWTLFTGRTFCAGVCPLGAVQELVLWRPVRVPMWLAHVLGLFPWVFLTLAVLYAALGLGYPICRTDPFVGLFRLGAPLPMAAMGGGVLALSLFVGRPYCRFVCPYGALLGLASRCSRRHVSITPTVCVQCRLCENACPYGAIRRPQPPAPQEARRPGVRRLAVLIASIPLVLLVSAGVGHVFGRGLSQVHPRVALAVEMQREGAGNPEAMSPEREVFLTTEGAIEELEAEVRRIRRRFAHAGALLGAGMAVITLGALFGLSRWRSREAYEPDRARCVSCTRCFSACPVEKAERLRRVCVTRSHPQGGGGA